MPKYNPNSIWKSPKKEEDVYTPSSAKPKPQVPADQGASVKNNEAVAAAAPAEEPFFKKTPIGQFDEPAPAKSHVFLWAAGIFVVLLGGGALYFFLRPMPGPNVTVGFTNPSGQVLVGDPFTLQVNLSNNANVALNNAILSVALPSNISLAGTGADPSVIQTSTGEIGPGSVNAESFNLIATGDPNSVQPISATLTYTTTSSSAQYQTEETENLVIGGPAISLTLAAPQSVFSGQDFQIPISYTNNTSHSFDSVELTLQYPSGFSFEGSTVQPDGPANDSWDLGTIPAAGNGTITLTGNVIGADNASYALTGDLTGSVGGNTYTLTNGSANLAIGSSPLSLSVSVNNTPNYVSKAGDTLNYTLTYTNNSTVTFQNVTISAALVGAMYDLGTIQGNGSFSSLTDAITWNAANTPALLNVAPGSTGSVNFEVRTLESYPIRLPSDKNYALQVNARIASPTVPPGTAASSTVSVTSLSNQVGGAISLVSEAFYRDTTSGISDTGPYPPKVNQATQYLLEWKVTNYATDAENVSVSAYLQSGTTCTGQIKVIMQSNASTTPPTCNAANGLITWNIPEVPATTGITDPPAEAIIQVTNTPAVNEVGSAVTLLGPATLTATDGFTGATLQSSAGDVTTAIPDDTSISPSANRNVTQ